MDEAARGIAHDAVTRQAAMSRRAVLLGAGAAVALPLLAACADDEPATIGPDQAALNAAALAEASLESAASGIRGGSAEVLAQVADAQAAHRAHVDALVAAGAALPSSAAPEVRPTAPTARNAQALAQAQEGQADKLESDALGVSPRIAQLLGSVAASDAALASLLRSAA